jgi:SAM-dependent methyltransferase
MKVLCIACESQETTIIGKLPIFTSDYLGRPLDATVDAGSLYRCSACTLLFRWPMPGAAELLTYYEGLDKDEWWQTESEREVWGYVARQLDDLPTQSVLDVGCFRGNMLRQIGSKLSCFGIEPSPSARAEAEAHGITIIGSSIDSLQTESRQFGAITLIDVAEHLPRPMESFRLLSQMLAPGGKLIVFTGATDAWSWQFVRQDYWYCGLPEHVAFYRPSWFDWAAPQLGVRVSSIRRLPFAPVGLRQRVDESLKNIAFVIYRRLKPVAVIGSLLSSLPLISRIGNWQSCWWTSARDHILITMIKIS